MGGRVLRKQALFETLSRDDVLGRYRGDVGGGSRAANR